MFLLILGAFVALGITLSTAPSGMATSTTATVAAMDAMGAPHCQDSGKAMACKTGMPACALGCAVPLLSLPASQGSHEGGALVSDFAAPDARPLAGSVPPPDPSPPRLASSAAAQPRAARGA